MTIVARAAVVMMFGLLGCATAPKSRADQQALEQRADATLQEMMSRNPSLGEVLATTAGYAVFPEVGKGGVIVGGAFGRGVLYDHGRKTGFVKLEQASLGAQLGGQTFAELLVLRDPVDVQNIRAGRYTVGADASVVVLTAGAGASAQAARGTTVFVLPRGGLMVDVSIAGQRVMYEPAG